ncbi:hypothetical protein O3G_MSEX001829 [Manduca sexta]|uniref:Mitochondrial ribosomal protein L32 n=1 Tax=Manduca sexta TaxID=7130 RepID=A0A921YLL9_MANSE|nr:hypothetical protein O3G_MSEX001829 [Manduca sexta]
MFPRFTYLIQVLRNVERSLINSIFHNPPKELALAYVHQRDTVIPSKKFSIKDIVGDGFLLAVPKFRRTIEKRLKRKYGSPEYVWKMLIPKTNIKVCHECGHYHEQGRLCEKCYKRVQEETRKIKNKIQEKIGNSRIEQDVIVLYEGESIPDQKRKENETHLSE